MNASIDGSFVGRHAIHYGASHEGIIRIISPDIAAGSHTLELEIDNLLARRMVQIDGISLRQPSGVDQNGNGIPDWVEDQLAEVDHVVPHASTSRTSPFFLEGNARIRDSLLVNGAPVEAGADSEHWYANFSMLSSYDTSYTVSFANGQQVSGEVFWWATNVLDNETLVIRQGDSLRLGAWRGNGNSANTEHPNKKSSQGNGVVSTITLDGVDHTLGNSRDTYNPVFNVTGTHIVTATHVSGATGTLTVVVKGASLPSDKVVVQNSVSYLELEDAVVDRTLFFEGGKGMQLGDLEEVDSSNFRFRLYPEEGGALGVVARLWEAGPIVDVAQIASVTMTDGLQNSLSTAFVSPEFDGYFVVSTPMVILDLPPGGYVVVSIFRAGVLFLDGTTMKTFYNEDFNNGIVTLEFLLPLEQDGGYCHNVEIYDANGNLIALR